MVRIPLTVRISNAVQILTIAALLVMTFGVSANAQKFDLKKYLQRIDVNQNGVLEKSEMSDNTRRFLGKMEIDTKKPVKIKTVLSKVNRDKKELKKKEQDKKRRSGPLKVPGFGVEQPETQPVQKFGIQEQKNQYSANVREQTQNTLDTFDRNRNGLIDKDEVKRARFNNPPARDSDTNGDGALSRSELLQRYHNREKARNKRKSSEDSDSSNRDRNRRSRRNRQSESKSKDSAASKPKDKKTSDEKTRYRKYVKGLIRSYDKDGDGRLNKEEVSRMRQPKTAVDRNNDGYVSQDELLANLTGEPSPASSTASTKTSKNRNSKRSSSRSRSSGSFASLDKNTDSRVEMHEYSAKWDDKKLKSFYERDKNGDGVITLKEWNASK